MIINPETGEAEEVVVYTSQTPPPSFTAEGTNGRIVGRATTNGSRTGVQFNTLENILKINMNPI